jgi:magnesium-transporting ATPase (P-type)
MTDDRFAARAVAGWYMFAAIGSLLFMLIACAGYVMDVTTDPQMLPLDQRAVVEARPLWMTAAYAIAVWVGVAGAVMLVLRRRLAQPLLLVSLIAAAVTFLPYAIVPGVRDNITTNDIAVAVMILAITWTIFWFARHSAQRGWLR